MNPTLDPLQRWREAAQGWGIPQHILDRAPVSPWVHAPAMFRSGADDPTDTPSMAMAREALGRLPDGIGSVLDIGCGGGRSSLPLAGAARLVIGVDHHQAMLEQFRDAAAAQSVDVATVLGTWPDVAEQTPSADVVVCHHVAYNVVEIGPFLSAMHAHAETAVIVELTATHPQSSLAPLWRHFWDLDRPTEPTAATFVDVVRHLGHEPTVHRWTRPQRSAPMARPEFVANLRQRLCLTDDRDAEIDRLIGSATRLSAEQVVTVGWLVQTQGRSVH